MKISNSDNDGSKTVYLDIEAKQISVTLIYLHFTKTTGSCRQRWLNHGTTQY
jgi:hypothetical protein